jgi:hypothetical protein
VKIVLAGSIKFYSLPDEVIQLLENWLDADVEFLVGDARGIDTEFQRYLKSKRYENVKVFFSGPALRNNLGLWPATPVKAAANARGAALHAAKDRRMTDSASDGLMVWDGESVGTIANVLDLLEREKKCYLYVDPDDELLRLESMIEVGHLAARFPTPFSEASKRLAKFKKQELQKDNEDYDKLF